MQSNYMQISFKCMEEKPRPKSSEGNVTHDNLTTNSYANMNSEAKRNRDSSKRSLKFDSNLNESAPWTREAANSQSLTPADKSSGSDMIKSAAWPPHCFSSVSVLGGREDTALHKCRETVNQVFWKQVKYQNLRHWALIYYNWWKWKWGEKWRHSL